MAGKYTRFKNKQDIHCPYKKSNQEGKKNLKIERDMPRWRKKWCTTKVYGTQGGGI